MAALTCPIYELGIEGNRGGGKTDVLLMTFARHVGTGLGRSWRGVIWRKEYKDLDDVIAKSRRWFPAIFPGARFLESTNHLRWVFADGEDLRFRAIKKEFDYWGFHGQEIPFHGWEELTEWPTLACYEVMRSTCRSSNPDVPKLYRSTFNPYGPGHNVVKLRFPGAAPERRIIRDTLETPDGKSHVVERAWIHLDRKDNRHLLEADPEYEARLVADSNPARRAAWVESSWDIVAGGAVDDVWRAGIHIIPGFDVPSSWTIDRAFDWGSAHPFSVGWWAESDGTDAVIGGRVRSFPPRTLFRVGEWYGWNGNPDEGCRMVDTEIARGIKERERDMGLTGRVRPGPADPSIFGESNVDSVASRMERAFGGRLFVRGDNSPGVRQRRLEVFRGRLQACLSQPMEEPGLFVVETCRHFIRTIPVIPRDEDKPLDVDTDSEDHIYDESGMRCMHRATRSQIMRASGV